MVHLATEAASAPIGQAAAEDASPLDLQPFCSTDEVRPYLMKPFSRHGFTWATNGHILVRVTLRSDISDVDKKFNIAGPLQDFESASFFKPEYFLPPPVPAPVGCAACDGRGHEHDCPSCGCICGACDGKGEVNPENNMSVSIGPTPFSLKYIRQILSLPGIEIETLAADQSMKPLFFRFDGGIGALMPLRSPHTDHVDLTRKSDEASSLPPDFSTAEAPAVPR